MYHSVDRFERCNIIRFINYEKKLIYRKLRLIAERYIIETRNNICSFVAKKRITRIQGRT